MGTTTFSGPIRSGTIRTGANANVGYALPMQAHTIDVSGGAIAQSDTAIILPANSAIVDVVIDVVGLLKRRFRFVLFLFFDGDNNVG